MPPPVERGLQAPAAKQVVGAATTGIPQLGTRGDGTHQPGAFGILLAATRPGAARLRRPLRARR